MHFNIAFLAKIKSLKRLAVLLLLCFTIVFSSCSTSKKGYRPTKRKKKDCDCSEWSNNYISTDNYSYLGTTAILVV